MHNRSWLWILLVLILVLACGCCGLFTLIALRSGSGRFWSGAMGNGIAVIPVHGVLVSGSSPGGFTVDGTVYAETLIEDIRHADANPAVRALVLDVNSPGGSVVASADIYRALWETEKLVIVSMGETAASGGYYIACAAQFVMARPATLTGSIGVRWDFTNAEELLRKLGVELQVIKSGRYKDQGSIGRSLTEQEVEMLQLIVDEAYDDFVQVIVEGRELPEREVRQLADGRVFSGLQAVELGLVDGIGSLEDAIDIAAKAVDIEGEPEVIYYERPAPGLFDALPGFLADVRRPAELAILHEFLGAAGAPKLQYLFVAP